MAGSDPKVKSRIMDELQRRATIGKVVRGVSMAELAKTLVPDDCSVAQFKRALGSLAFKDRRIIVVHRYPDEIGGARQFFVRPA